MKNPPAGAKLDSSLCPLRCNCHSEEPERRRRIHQRASEFGFYSSLCSERPLCIENKTAASAGCSRPSCVMLPTPLSSARITEIRSLGSSIKSSQPLPAPPAVCHIQFVRPVYVGGKRLSSRTVLDCGCSMIVSVDNCSMKMSVYERTDVDHQRTSEATGVERRDRAGGVGG